jgi:DNA-binding transcriptional regulator YbjK
VVKETSLLAVDRRTKIAHTAIRLIGSLGARGLTHRAVDAAAKLPQGSTSYYCRTRADLLALALRRHAELDFNALGRLERSLRTRSKRRELASHLALVLSKWMRAQSAEELAARFELFLAASREPALQAVVAESRKRFVAALRGSLEASDVPDAERLAAALIALIEGLFVERLRIGRDAMRRRDLEALLMALLTAPSLASVLPPPR